MMVMIPASTKMSSKIETTPEVNSSFRASTSVVTRVTRRPDRFLVVKADVHVLQMTENLAPQVEHDLLASPLHEVGLRELQDKTQSDNARVDSPNLRDAGIRVGTEEAVQKSGGLMGPDKYLSISTLTRKGPTPSPGP